ncbi:LysR family transcriptional regulator substrate-binding protein [Clostridium thailandense]|uniref:LysR family transcriptional regulator substrate-binding protein n=1 Tax=Clostridium thailandense TaxID=2794346 RepID=UPI0035E44ACD
MKDEPVCILATKENWLTAKTDVTIYDFKDVPIILTQKDCCYRKRFENSLIDASIVPKVILETSSIQVIKETALSDLGVCLLPKFTVQKELDNHSIERISYSTNYNISAQLIYHKDKWISPHLLGFISTVQNCY